MKQLISLISSLKSQEEIKDFLLGFFTPQEIDQLQTRLQIVKLLKQGLPQHEIAEKLGVGVATVTRGANELKKGRFTYV